MRTQPTPTRPLAGRSRPKSVQADALNPRPRQARQPRDSVTDTPGSLPDTLSPDLGSALCKAARVSLHTYTVEALKKIRSLASFRRKRSPWPSGELAWDVFSACCLLPATPGSPPGNKALIYSPGGRTMPAWVINVHSGIPGTQTLDSRAPGAMQQPD